MLDELKRKSFMKLYNKEMGENLLEEKTDSEFGSTILFVLHKDIYYNNDNNNKSINYSIRAYSLNEITAKEYKQLTDQDNPEVIDYMEVNISDFFPDKFREELTEKKRELMKDGS